VEADSDILAGAASVPVGILTLPTGPLASGTGFAQGLPLHPRAASSLPLNSLGPRATRMSGPHREMRAISAATNLGFQLHVKCFSVWDTERDELASWSSSGP
jgi:hypothetical protein